MSKALLCVWTIPCVHLREKRVKATPDSGLHGNENLIPTVFPYPVVVKPPVSAHLFASAKVSEERPAGCGGKPRALGLEGVDRRDVVGSEVGCACLGNDADLICRRGDQFSIAWHFHIHQRVA